VKAYDKFVSQAHGKVKASLAVSLVEIRESFTMIHKRAQQLINFGTALAKRDFGGVVRALGLAKDSTMRLSRRMYRQARKEQTRRLRTVWDRQAVKPRSFANNYLEFIFGWKPFVDDIASCIEVLQRSFESQTVRSRASSDSRAVTTKPLIWNVQPYTVDDLKQEFKLLLQAKIGIDNPNLLLANELGFINPVQVAWQVIPFSFLVDWFIPVGKFLGSYTDFVGLRVIDPFVSRLYRAEHVYRTDYGGMAGRGNEVRYGKGHRFYRDLWSLNVPTLKSRIGLPTNGLAGKAASSVALLIQQLSNRK
jgi:hypothetical protein